MDRNSYDRPTMAPIDVSKWIDDNAMKIINRFTTSEHGSRICSIQHCTTAWPLSDPPAANQLQLIIWHLKECHQSELSEFSAEIEQLQEILKGVLKDTVEGGESQT